MTRFRVRSALLVAPLLALIPSTRAEAQEYFGRNKVQYESFNWKILKSEHFDNFFYPPESTIVRDAARNSIIKKVNLLAGQNEILKLH